MLFKKKPPVRQPSLFNNASDLAQYLAKVEGQISNDEMFELYLQATNLTKGDTVVEIGSYRGKSTLALALGAKRVGARVYAIDPHEEFIGVAGGIFGPADLKKMIASIAEFDLGDVIFPVCMGSHEAGKIWSKPISLLWIDGDHSYEGVSGDFNLFSIHLKPNARLMFHDSEMEGVAKLLGEISEQKFRVVKKVHSISVFEKI